VFFGLTLWMTSPLSPKDSKLLYLVALSPRMIPLGGDMLMVSEAHEALAKIATVGDMVAAFANEERCRRLLEAMVWPRGRVCPACGCRQSTALAGRDIGRRARPGLYQCANGECRFQFTVTTRTPLHSTKLPLRVWLTGLWLIRKRPVLAVWRRG